MHAGGRRFEPDHLHHPSVHPFIVVSCRGTGASPVIRTVTIEERENTDLSIHRPQSGGDDYSPKSKSVVVDLTRVLGDHNRQSGRASRGFAPAGAFRIQVAQKGPATRRPWADGKWGKRLRQTVDALGPHADEGRGEPRNAPGSRTQAMSR